MRAGLGGRNENVNKPQQCEATHTLIQTSRNGHTDANWGGWGGHKPQSIINQLQ
jgi:hypothetical protein